MRNYAIAFLVLLVASACGSSSEIVWPEEPLRVTTTAADDGDDAAPAATTAAPAATTAAPATTAAEVKVVASGSLLDAVQARGTLNCGVSGSAVAFSETQADGSVTGDRKSVV